MPKYAVLVFIITLSAIGFPGTIGFTAESLILAGTFQFSLAQWAQSPFYFFLGVASLLGVLLSALYMLRLIGAIFWGEGRVPGGKVSPDINAREITVFSILTILILFLGLFPHSMLETFRAIGN